MGPLTNKTNSSYNMVDDPRERFEDSCDYNNLDYDFEYLGLGFKDSETNKAFIIFNKARLL